MRQFDTVFFERVVLSPAKVSPLVTLLHPDALSIFKDSYVVEFLHLLPTHNEADLHQGLLGKLKEFLLELGRDFCFIGSEFPIQVGKQDFALDLLFFRSLALAFAFSISLSLSLSLSQSLFLSLARSPVLYELPSCPPYGSCMDLLWIPYGPHLRTP